MTPKSCLLGIYRHQTGGVKVYPSILTGSGVRVPFDNPGESNPTVTRRHFCALPGCLSIHSLFPRWSVESSSTRPPTVFPHSLRTGTTPFFSLVWDSSQRRVVILVHRSHPTWTILPAWLCPCENN